MKTFSHKDFSRLLTEFTEFAARRFISGSAKDQIRFAQHLVSFRKPVQIALSKHVSYKRFSGKNRQFNRTTLFYSGEGKVYVLITGMLIAIAVQGEKWHHPCRGVTARELIQHRKNHIHE